MIDVKDNPKGLFALIAIVFILIIATQGESVNRLPGIQVKGGGVTIDIGDMHYHTKGV